MRTGCSCSSPPCPLCFLPWPQLPLLKSSSRKPSPEPKILSYQGSNHLFCMTFLSLFPTLQVTPQPARIVQTKRRGCYNASARGQGASLAPPAPQSHPKETGYPLKQCTYFIDLEARAHCYALLYPGSPLDICRWAWGGHFYSDTPVVPTS